MSEFASARTPGTSKGTVTLVHLYPREMSIYGDLGNTRALASRLRWHGYDVEVVGHAPGDPWRDDVHLVMGGGGQDSGQARVESDLERIGGRLVELAADGCPMLAICGMYQLFGNAFITVEGQRLPGLGILDVTTTGNAKRMIGGIVLDTEFGEVVGFENHSGSTVLGPEQRPFGRVRAGQGKTGPRARSPATSSGPTCTARSCRPTRLSRTPWSGGRRSGRPGGPSSPSRSTTRMPTTPAPARSADSWRPPAGADPGSLG